MQSLDMSHLCHPITFKVIKTTFRVKYFLLVFRDFTYVDWHFLWPLLQWIFIFLNWSFGLFCETQHLLQMFYLWPATGIGENDIKELGQMICCNQRTLFKTKLCYLIVPIAWVRYFAMVHLISLSYKTGKLYSFLNKCYEYQIK